MRIRVKSVRESLHPRERFVTLETTEGEQHMVVHERALEGNTLEVGYPISASAEDKTYLVELPQETTTGSWRVRIPQSSLIPA